MSSAQNNGGPAFPIMTTVFATDPDGNPVQSNVVHHGMTLRDYFAAHAPDHAVSDYMEIDVGCETPLSKFGLPKYSEEEARYRYADAMIVARNGGAR